jgi:DHA1 family bicyclomycin/chloramphenicol resistance-like MFS transporter
MLSHTPLHLALGYAGFFAIGASFWFWERRCERRREAAAALA